MNAARDIRMRMRPAQRADQAVLRAIAPSAVCTVELPPPAVESPPWCNVFEADGEIVAWERHRLLEIALVDWAPLPPTFSELPWTEGDRLALVGFGLVLARPLPDSMLRRIHRLARTLASDEHGARYTVSRVPLPRVEPYGPEAVCQQIAAGAIEWSPVALPLADGYWPIRVGSDDTAWLVREATWA